jgi:hypothetical protein
MNNERSTAPLEDADYVHVLKSQDKVKGQPVFNGRSETTAQVREILAGGNGNFIKYNTQGA